MKTMLLNDRGITLMEVVAVIVILGILMSVAAVKLDDAIETAKFEATRSEMEAIANGIAGDPNLYDEGSRSDFGYVGDVGAMPPDLDALHSNPGGYSTWDGPYVEGAAEDYGYKIDGWGVNYVLMDTLLRSSGSGSNLDKILATSITTLLANQVAGVVLDASGQPPQLSYVDSVLVVLSYPDGVGGINNSAANPGADGSFSFSNVPIGNHTLSVIAVSDSDTVTYPVTVYPGKTASLSIVFPADLF